MISGDFVAGLVLNTLDDGGVWLPYFVFVPEQGGEIINNELHSIKNHSVERLEELVAEGSISRDKADFLIEVKKLINMYDNSEIGNCDELVGRIFDMMDNGFAGHKYVVRAGIEPEVRIDYDEQFEDKMNVFPTDYPVISGNLAKRYREKYMGKTQDKTIKTTGINAHTALNASLGGKDKVSFKDIKNVKDSFGGIGNLVKGGTIDDR